MARTEEFWYEDLALKTYIEEEIGIIKIKCNVFDTITDLVESGKFISFFHIAEINPKIKAILILNEGGCMNEEEYEKFLKRIMFQQGEKGTSETHQPLMRKLDRSRQINILNRIIHQLVEFKKISFVGLQQSIVTPFFGTCLGADFRFASENMSFSLMHLKYGLPPSGALPFFLPRYVPHGKAIEILLTRERIDAQEALQLGLVNKIFPVEDFEKSCFQEIHKICLLDPQVIHTTKLLLNFSRSELHRYFDTESALTV